MRLIFQRSRLLLGYLLFTHVAALLLVGLLRLHWLMMISLLLFIAASLLRDCRHHGWLGYKPAVTAIKINADNRWFVVDGKGQEQGPFDLKSSVILGPLIVLYLQSASQRRTSPLVLARDAVATDHWRLLRIRLRAPESWD